MGHMMCFAHSGVAEVLGALDVLLGVPGCAEHFEAADAFERVPDGVASRGLSSSRRLESPRLSRAVPCARVGCGILLKAALFG